MRTDIRPAKFLSPALRLATAACLLWAFPLIRVSRAESGPQPLALDHADSTELIQHEGATEYHLFGGVRFTQGETRLRSDRALWIQETGHIQFDGHVAINQPGRYLEADQVTYRRDDRSFRALGHVLVEDTTESFSLRSERAQFDRAHESALADSLPVVRWGFLLDSASQTIIWADTILYSRTGRHGIGRGHVRVHKGDWYSEGDYGEVWPDSEKAVLIGSPKASGLRGEITGDTLVMSFHGKSVNRLQALGHASGSYEDTTVSNGGRNLLHGRQADFFLANDSLHAIRVKGEAVTDQQPRDPSGGRNHASGDSLWLVFDRGRLTTVTIDGGAQGSYQTMRADGGQDTVNYQAARIVFIPDSNRIDLVANSRLRYGTVQLDAGRISYWTTGKNLLARPLIGVKDTANALQRPQLADGQQTVVGDTLTYNIDSQRGRIRGSSTKFENAYYRGGDFRKYTDSVFFVTNGIYTTCDRDTPHFRFESRDMEIIRNDKIIARPVVMRIGELPVAILPYYIFPIKKGRHSGFLPLRFGNFERGQRFIGNAGYYWAASDYWDGEAALDFNEATGILLRSTLNYALRYHLTGSVSGSYARESNLNASGRTRSTRWSIRASHRQELAPTATLSGNADFISDKSFYQNYSYDPADRRLRTLRSQANFNKRFARSSLTALVQNTENLDTDSRTLYLPRIDFPSFQRALIPPDSGATPRWYNNAYVSYGSSLNNYQDRVRTPGDTTGKKDERRYLTVSHNASISFPQRFLGGINISPSSSLQEAWYYVFRTRLAQEKGVSTETPGRRLSGSLGIGTSMNLYGFLNPHLFGLSTIRHTITPSISYGFTPPVTRHDDLRDFTGLGGGSNRKSQTVSLSLNNVFDAKLGEGAKERKVSLFNAGFSSGYNFESLSRKWSYLQGSARTNLASRLDFAVGATWDLYDPATLKLQWTNPRLLSFDVSAGMTLHGTGSALSSVTGLGSGHRDTLFDATSSPFNIGFSHRYSETRGSFQTSKTHWTGIRVDFKPTTNWSVQFQQTVNWALHKITDQRFELHRNLHCWEAQFVWVPSGSGQGYYFRISVRDLPDIKLERSESGLRGAFSGFGYP